MISDFHFMLTVAKINHCNDILAILNAFLKYV